MVEQASRPILSALLNINLARAVYFLVGDVAENTMRVYEAKLPLDLLRLVSAVRDDWAEVVEQAMRYVRRRTSVTLLIIGWQALKPACPRGDKTPRGCEANIFP